LNAIILAAGLGTRLAAHSRGRPKCLLPLHGRTILDWQLALLDQCGVERVTVVVGHQAAEIERAAGQRANYAVYPHYARTNNLHTLQHCGHLLDDEVTILFADVLVSAGAFARCARADADCALLVDTAQRRPDTMRVRLAEGRLADIGAHVSVDDADGNFIGIAKFSARGAGALRRELDRMVEAGRFEQAYYTAALPRLAAAGVSISVIATGEDPWCEIDSPDDYQRALNASFYVRC
jgi:choline kinase